MKKLMTILVAASFGGLAVVARLGATPQAAIAAGSCRGARSPAVADAAGLATGSIVAAVDGDAVAIGGQVTRVTPPDRSTGVLRHVSARAGIGTTYVRDRRGGDVVVADTPAGVRRFRVHGEALNPSLSATGRLVWAQGGGLRIVDAGSPAVRRIAGPVRNGMAFSPLFNDEGTIVAGIAPPGIAAVP